MRTYIVLVAVAGMVGLFADEALAEKTISLSNKHSRADIKAHCDAAGGDMADYKGGGYGCNVLGGGVVNCNKKGKCVGSTSRQVPGGGRTVGGLLGTKAPGASSVQRRASDSSDTTGGMARGDRRVAPPAISADPARPMRGGSVQHFGGGARRH